MKTKRKNIFKSLLALTLALIMVLGVAPLSEFAGVDWATLFVPKAEAATYGIYTYGVSSDNKVTIIGCNKSAKGAITIPSKIDEKSVTSIGYVAFRDCTNLTSITIPDSVTRIGSMAFRDCTGLTSITLSNSVTSIGDWAFWGCTGLTSITIPDSVTSIGIWAFLGCTGLTSITLGNNVTSIREGVFDGCTGLISINVASGNNYYSDNNGVLFNKEKTELIKYPAGKSQTSYTIPNSVTSIGKRAFYKCTGLTSITIPNSVTSIGDWVFDGCTGLTCINVASDNNYYSGNNGVLFNKKKTELIRYPEGESQTSYTIPNSVTSIGEWAFRDCTDLTSITIPNSVTSIGNSTFLGCTGLTSITIPNSVTSIGDWVFDGCTGLTCINVASDNNYYSGNNGVLFNKKKTELIRYPEGESQTSYTIPNSVTSIGEWAFRDCTDLTSITIPNSVTSIEYGAFAGCAGLKDVYYTGTPEQWTKVSIGSNNDCLVNCIAFESGGSMSDEEMNKYITEHINFHESKFDSFESNNGFYDLIWFDEKGRRLLPFKIWDIVGDVGEVATFKFDDLTISADYYELFLADFMMLINNKEVSKEIDYGVLKVGDDIYSGIKKALKSTDEWEKEISGIGSVEVEVKGFFTDPDYEISDKTRNILEKVLKEGFDKHEKEIDKVFSGLNLSSDIFGAIQDTTDIVSAFKDAQNAYQVALSYKNANEEVFNILYAAAEKMKETNPKHAKWFKESLDSYREKALNDDAIYSYTKSLAADLGWKAYDLIIKDFAKKAALNGVSKVLGCNPGKLGLTYAAVTASYNLTYEVLNAVLPAGKAKTPYYLMHYISTFEKGLSQTVRSYGNTLEILKNSDVANAYKSAENYDLAFNMLRAANKYLYECSYNFCANNHAKDELVYATAYKNEWVNAKCHNMNAKSGKSKFVSIQCPTNVSVCDSAGKRILSIVDGKIVECDPSITVMNYAGKKSFCYPADRDYTIKIDATADGSMNYYVCDIDSDRIERSFEFYDIPLKNDESFNGNIPAESDASGSVYGLKSSLGNDVSRSYDSSDDCGDGKHSFCEWKTVQEPSCTEFGSEIRVCAMCKKQEYRITNIQHGQYELKNYKSNCESDGYSGDKYCSICGELIEKGSVITKAGHTFGSWQIVTEPTIDSEGLEKRVCSKCGAEETRAISKLEPVQVTDVELDITQKALNVGDTFTLTATVKPDNATDKSVTWSSSNTSVATVDENGVVTAVTEGTATITATASNGVEASCTVTVKQKGDSILKKIFKFIFNIILAPFRAIINLFKKLFGK